jgi:hypothetical protein
MYVTPTGGTMQTVKITWKEITDNTDDHRWEWFVDVTEGGGRVVSGQTGYLTFNDAGTLTAVNGDTTPTAQDRTITITDPGGNQATLQVPDPAAAPSFATANTLFTITSGTGLNLDAIFDNGSENDLSMLQRWQVTDSNLATVEIRLRWLKGSEGDPAQATTENPEDTEHQTDSNYWRYELEILTAGRTFVETGTNIARGTLIFGDQGDVSGGAGANAGFTLNGTTTVIRAPAVNALILTFSLQLKMVQVLQQAH